MKKVSVTIGIIAYNEEQNIGKLLASISKQKGKNYNVAEILVYSDGSTDKTAEMVKKFANKKITLIENKKRIGKSEHLNRLFKKAKNPIIVLFDADVVLASIHTIEQVIQPFLQEKTIMLVAGDPIPVKGTTFIENAVNYTFNAYYQLKDSLRGGNNSYGCDGRILALRREFARIIKVPRNTFANDAYLYFSCISRGFGFVHTSKAKVWFRSPTNVADQIKQNKRFIAAHKQMQHFFGNIVLREYSIPRFTIWKLMLQECIKHPVHALAISAINLYCRYKANEFIGNQNAKWPIAQSTKGGISK